MPEGYFKLTRQTGNMGMFAAVRLSVEPAEPPVHITVAESDEIPRFFVPAVETGIHIAWDRLLTEGQKPPHTNVAILEIQETTADTSTIMVVYAAIEAYCNALGKSLREPVTISGRQMVFPLGRLR